MHDTDAFARMPALDSHAAQPPAELVQRFETQCEVLFKGELYLVRDNGAVLRRARPQGRYRKLDECWSFGALNKSAGYLEIAGQRVHRIVATAFHGPAPSAEHVVDHIDTNRLNNRPDNLRWVTRLDNILLNPITCARIVLRFGSLEAFFENPGAQSVPNLEWMRVVTKEQAAASRARLLAWAENGQAGKGGALGDWVFQVGPQGRGVSDQNAHASASVPRDIPSLTPGAVQRRWYTPTEFPQCPDGGADSLAVYLDRLAPGAVFARSAQGESIVEAAAMGPDGALSIVCRQEAGVKPWAHARVRSEDGVLCHEAGGTFFTFEGAMKAHCTAIGAPTAAYEGSFDDFC